MEYPKPPVPPGKLTIEFVNPDIAPRVHLFKDMIGGWRTMDSEGRSINELVVNLNIDESIRYPLANILSIQVVRNGRAYLDELNDYRNLLHVLGHLERKDPDHPANHERVFNSKCLQCVRQENHEMQQRLMYDGVVTPRTIPDWSPLPEVQTAPRHARSSVNPVTWVIDTIMGRK